MSKQVPAIKFDLDGFKCVRFFAPGTNQLCVTGPKGCMDAGLQYSMKYSAMCQKQSLRLFLQPVEAEPDMNRKLHAVLHLMEKYKSEIAAGMGISHEQVIEALAEWDHGSSSIPKARVDRTTISASRNPQLRGDRSSPPFFQHLAAPAARANPTGVTPSPSGSS
jgi:hypothetical protein